jgi:hypothetical protein
MGNASGRAGMRYPRWVVRKSRFAPLSSVRSNATPKARRSQASFNHETDDPGSPEGCSQPSSPPLCGGVMTAAKSGAKWLCGSVIACHPSRGGFLGPLTSGTVLPALVPVPSVPLGLTRLFRGMPGMWKGRHRRMLGGLIVMPALFPGRKTVEARARWTPAALTVGRLRRVRKAADWEGPRLVAWGAQKRCRRGRRPKTGRALAWATAVSNSRGARKILGPTRAAQARPSPGCSGCALPRCWPRGRSSASLWPVA